MTATLPVAQQTRFGRAGAFTVELFSPTEVARTVAAIEDVPDRLRRECWRVPGSNGMATIGEPLYRNRERFGYYTDRARAENHVLYQHFRLAHDRVAAFFEQRYGAPVVYAQELAVPGFHVFDFERPGDFDGGGWHLDLLHTQVPYFAGRHFRIADVVNFTVPFEVPDGGSGMDLEDDLPGARAPGGGAAVTVPYRPGTMLFTEAEHWHRIGASHCHTPGQRRITLQGHGVRLDTHWLLYW
ncbi:hypothetical protein [Actinophytocola sp.]|uniref:hypothetical protein n=1 Tax=Actinophytocola sp. TaxID=1872138 RepID=UPI002D803D17|nr:hypothetical protein [Actinophytocola sp.]HET9141632.1 hypothetical protein [Actinophytocola sp.]